MSTFVSAVDVAVAGCSGTEARVISLGNFRTF